VSSDNGIYILVTDKTEGELDKSEYRVAYAQGIDNIYGGFDSVHSCWEGNNKFIKETFEKSEVFDSLEEALDKAEVIAVEYPYLEDGICVINNFQDRGHLFRE